MEVCSESVTSFNFNDKVVQTPTYSILNEAQIRQRQEDDISRVSAAISEPRSSAIVLLRRFDWNLNKLFDHWFDDQPRVRAMAGLLFPNPDQTPPDQTTCRICFQTRADMASASCGHPFCRNCWSEYISRSINHGGSGILLLTCPAPSCPAAVGEDMVEALSESHSDKEKFSRILLRSYIEDSYLKRRIKWCPAPDCFYAFDFTDVLLSGGRNLAVECRCGRCFCWGCAREPHRPVDCAAAARWASECTDESATAKWILANTKPCPKCSRPIHKDQGCDAVTCAAPCHHHFCWRCLGSYGHSINLCPAPEEPDSPETEAVRAELRKHECFYVHWASNAKLRHEAEEELRVLRSWHLDTLLLGLLVQAWEQLIRCRRSLQWTYTYAYYFPDHQPEKKQFFDYLLSEAVLSLDRLQECADELQTYLDEPGSSAKEFVGRLSELSSAVGKYFENLMVTLEEGLPEVVTPKPCYWLCEVCSYSNSGRSRCDICCSLCPAIAKLSF